MTGDRPRGRKAGRKQPALRLVHSRVPGAPSCAPSWAVPASLAQRPDAGGGRRGRPGRRSQALLIVESLPQPGEGGPPGPADPCLVLALALRRLSYEVTVAPADGVLDRGAGLPQEHGLAANGIACLGRPRHRSVEEMLHEHAGRFDLVCLAGAAMTRAYEPLVRLHDPEARVLCCLPGLAHPALLRQAAQDPALLRAARAVQRQEMLAAYLSDAAIVPTAEEAGLLEAALPALSVHVAAWPAQDAAAVAAGDGALRLAVRVALRGPVRGRQAQP